MSCPHGVGASVCRHCEGLDQLRDELAMKDRGGRIRCAGFGGGCSYYVRSDAQYCTDCELARLRADLAAAIRGGADLVAQRDTALGLCKQREQELAKVSTEKVNLGRALQNEAENHASTRAELEATRADFAELELERQKTAAELAETRKALELQTELRNIALRGEQTARAELATALERVKAATSRLVTDIGKCEHCGERAPLMQGAKLPSHKLQSVCVYGWGCSAGEVLRNG